MEIVFISGLFVIAYLYASVGHGGASGYLALMAIYGVVPCEMKSSGLILNVFVSLTAFIFFLKKVQIQWRLAISLVIASVPLSFFGAGLNIPAILYKKLLAIVLLLSVIKMMLPKKNNPNETMLPNYFISSSCGGIIGFISGIIGIGGGIILSPLMIINKWATIKETACISSLFIFLNSLAGLGGMLHNNTLFLNNKLPVWVAIVLMGGITGSYMGSSKFSSKWLLYLLSIILVIASVKLIWI